LGHKFELVSIFFAEFTKLFVPADGVLDDLIHRQFGVVRISGHRNRGSGWRGRRGWIGCWDGFGDTLVINLFVQSSLEVRTTAWIARVDLGKEGAD
jgi:hypothetical protein